MADHDIDTEPVWRGPRGRRDTAVRALTEQSEGRERERGENTAVDIISPSLCKFYSVLFGRFLAAFRSSVCRGYTTYKYTSICLRRQTAQLRSLLDAYDSADPLPFPAVRPNAVRAAFLPRCPSF